MSIIQKIRDKYAALAIAVIAIAMVGFILIDALSSRTGGGMFSKNTTTVGVVDGEKIEYVDFDNQMKRAEQNYQAKGMQVSEELREQINNTLWSTLVDQKVLTEQVDKLGLTFTGKELEALLYGPNPPEALREKFTDPKTGEYNATAVAQKIKELRHRAASDAERVGFEDYIDNEVVKEALRNKYLILLMGASYYPKWLAEKDNQDNSALASISYVSIPYAMVADTTVPVSDEDVKNYIADHKTEFAATDATSNLSFVVFNADPSGRDSSAALTALVDLKAGFADAKDDAAYLNQNGSSIAFFDGFVSKSAIMVPNKDSIMSLPLNGIYGPYVDNGNYVFAKLLEKRDLPDSVKCRHILIATQNGQIPDSIAKQRMDSVVNVLQKGADFKAVAAAVSDDPGSKDKGGEYTFSYSQAYLGKAGEGLVKPFADFVFFGKTGDKKVVKSDFGYHYIEILDQRSIEPYYKVAYLAKDIAPSDETINTANAAATNFSAQAQGSDGFEETARKGNLAVRVATVKETDYAIPGIGEARRLVKWAFDNKTNAIGDPESFNNKYVVAKISGKQDAGVPTGASARTLVENSVRRDKKAQMIEKKLGSVADLNVGAAFYKVAVQRADSVNFAAQFIPNVGNEPKVLGAAFFKGNLNKVSATIQGTTGVFLLKTESVISLPNQNNDYNLLRQNQEGTMRNSIGYAALEGLHKAADIKDYRIRFY